MKNEDRQRDGLYRSEYEHDACGVGMVANLDGEASHEIVVNGLTILKRLMHRGATGNDPETGDGAGILVRIPRAFFKRVISHAEPRRGGDAESFGVAMIFGGEGEESRIENIVRTNSCEVLGWRDVPIDPSAIGPVARKAMPRIRQLFISRRAAPLREKEFERRLYVVRRQIEKAVHKAYICSCSSRTIVYKGLLLATQMEKFYPDLSDPDFVSPFAIVHQRYSTNTFPTWELAHPFRAIAHNGEINAIKGNLNALAARESSLSSDVFGDDLKKLLPIVHGGQSDSASLDNIFELLVAAGRDAPHAMMMLLPQAWGRKYHMGHDVRAFYEYHSALMEPWDGPAAVAFTDGMSLGAALDRNGLRPARWTLTNDGLFVLASEAGVLDIEAERVHRHGRLRPGSLLWLDLEKHRLMEDTELKTFYARRRPYRRWVMENHIPVTGLFSEIVPSKTADGEDGRVALQRDQQRFGYSLEDIEHILRPMAEEGHENVGAMGNDAALACLRGRAGARPSLMFDYFHQLFAQVTNPPIDPIREELVMSIMTYIGNDGNILSETPGHAKLVKMTRPVLTDDELRRLRNIPDFPARTLPMFFGDSLKAALDELADSALRAAQSGAKIIVLSDRDESTPQRSRSELPQPSQPSQHSRSELHRIPSLIAVAAVNKALVKAGLRPSVGIVVESGEVREVHHFAVLLGFGATAVNPYLALATVSEIGREDAVKAAANYVSAVCKGLMKIMSKMGISTLRSYRSARIFEAVGLGPKIMSEYFSGVVSPVGGLELEDIESIQRPVSSNQRPVANDQQPVVGGEYHTRKGGEEHLWTPQRIVDFRESVRRDDYGRFKRYTDEIDKSSAVTLRSQLEFKVGGSRSCTTDDASFMGGSRSCATADAQKRVPPVVEPVDSIVKRFVGGAMSLGSLSPEAHETIALALNGLGTMSNCGEGGENSERFGTDRNCGIKQVASGRFGVTIEYLHAAKDLQIKLAQGAKPGEGGQLPAHKVNAFVAKLRHAKPGTTLISPPPHHDIYSIEDLAQLIYDLKCANPGARVSVKLVSEAGVGTIAAGVAKAHADVIVISGFDGGTGAAPLTSMKHAGLPWEVGLAEAHQTLVKNDLRDRVKLQVDGQLRTGRDIVIGAMLGADEFAFGTSMLVSLGCVQCRNCNLNCCPVGIATQREELRRCFAGKPEHLQRYFRFLAEEVREHLAALGLSSLAETRGRADLLAPREGCKFDFSDVLKNVEVQEQSHGLPSVLPSVALAKEGALEKDGDAEAEAQGMECLPQRRGDAEGCGAGKFNDPALADNYDVRELLPELEKALAHSSHLSHSSHDSHSPTLTLSRTCRNVDRSVGAMLSGEIAGLRMGGPRCCAAADASAAVPEIVVNFTGVGGQSFGAFLAKGITFNLRGEANDYLAKSLSGGVITIAPPQPAQRSRSELSQPPQPAQRSRSELSQLPFIPEVNVIAGNVIAYGATSGSVFINGLAGERFAIRNSGATLVVEGVGDHGCEYMTGGTVVVIGGVGVNFAAGMTGGVAYVYDETGDLDLNSNLDSVDIFPVEEGSEDEKDLLALLNEHIERTGSPKASRLLSDWTNARPLFAKVQPVSAV